MKLLFTRCYDIVRTHFLPDLPAERFAVHPFFSIFILVLKICKDTKLTLHRIKVNGTPYLSPLPFLSASLPPIHRQQNTYAWPPPYMFLPTNSTLVSSSHATFLILLYPVK